MKETANRQTRHKRTRQLCAAMKRAQIAAAKKAMQFGQLLYVARNGKVVGVDPRKVLRLANAMA
ncbi:MAG: hypothetical protein LBV28_02265 [Puniceicoccales bacterium]|jgi:hypothetical protein|nr:hypothetical protein [Puniceicoccales bacterium]